MKQALINHLKANAELIEALSKHLLLEEAAKVAPAPAPAAPVPPAPAAPVPPAPAAPVPPAPVPPAPVPPAPAPAVIDAAAIVAKLHQLTTNRADDGALAFALLADYKVKRVSDIPKESFPEFAGIIDWYIANPDQQHTAVGGVA
ncbi:hypothetical protein [Thiolapillus sp.]|uniref:hypothetical protein n=1 Tax=Thiolapillus sp. TaxID=2017437 RepID=UPI003AF85BDC